jgi:hypothetical protein
MRVQRVLDSHSGFGPTKPCRVSAPPESAPLQLAQAPCDLCTSQWVQRFELDDDVGIGSADDPSQANDGRSTDRVQHRVAPDVTGMDRSGDAREDLFVGARALT